MITKEMIDDAGGQYQDKVYNTKKAENDYEAFVNGANWAIQQMNNDAVEFAEWVHNADWYYIKERNYWVTGNGIDELESKEFYPRITRTSQELYQLYLNSKIN